MYLVCELQVKMILTLRRQRKAALTSCGDSGADVSIKETEIQSSDEFQFQSNTLRYISKLSCPKDLHRLEEHKRVRELDNLPEIHTAKTILQQLAAKVISLNILY